MAEAQNNQQKNQEQDLNQILKARREKLANLQAAGKDPFVITKYDQTHHSQEIKDNFEALEGQTEPEIVANVPPNCFMPRPNVGSAVIRLTCHEKSPVEVKDERFMFDLIRASFNQRRKTLVNGLGNAGFLSVTKEQVTEALEKMGLSATIRGEALSLEQFAELSNLLK